MLLKALQITNSFQRLYRELISTIACRYFCKYPTTKEDFVFDNCMPKVIYSLEFL